MASTTPLTTWKTQHQELEELFSRLESASDSLSRESLAAHICEKLAVHTTFTETFASATSFEASAARGALRRVMALLLDLDGEDETFGQKLAALRGETQRRLEDEARHLFPDAA